MGEWSKSAREQYGVSAELVGGVIGGVPEAPPPPMPPMRIPVTVTKSEASTVKGATGATLGELFEYNFAGPVTIRRNQSAMLPFLQDKISARKLLIYKESDGEHPVNAAEVTNTSGKTLDGGPITVYNAGAYAGEALVETFKAGDKRLIGYAVDYGTRVTSNFENGEENVLEIHASNGTLEVKSSVRDAKTYEIRNVDAKAKILIVQQDVQGEYKMVSPKPTERTATAYRFEVQVPANGSKTLKVQQERVNSDTVAVSSATPDSLVEIISGKKLSETGRNQLGAIVALKRKASRANMDELSQDQTRLRENIDSLNRVKGQEDKVSQYSTRLNDNEVKLAELRDKRNELRENLDGAKVQLADAVGKLRF